MESFSPFHMKSVWSCGRMCPTEVVVGECLNKTHDWFFWEATMICSRLFFFMNATATSLMCLSTPCGKASICVCRGVATSASGLGSPLRVWLPSLPTRRAREGCVTGAFQDEWIEKWYENRPDDRCGPGLFSKSSRYSLGIRRL